MAASSKDFLDGDGFEAVLIIFYCYDYGAKFLDFGVTDKPYFKSPHSSNTTR